jgi:deoxyribonucleoside regulator
MNKLAGKVSIEKLEILARVASKYYKEEKTQIEIANEMGISRVKVYRLLKEALEKNIVDININWPIREACALENKFEEIFGLRKALIVQNNQPFDLSLKSLMGELAANYLESILIDGMTMAICTGSSTYETIKAIAPSFKANVRVAQAVGSLPFNNNQKDSPELVRLLSEKLGGEVIYLSSPMIADSSEAAKILKEQTDIKNTLNAARNADVVLSGIGPLDPKNSKFVKNQIVSSEEIEQLIAENGAGDVLGQVIKINGEKIDCEYNDRIIGLTYEEIKKIPNRIAVASGVAKSKAILGVLRSKTINVLCTDEITATAILELNKTI